MKYFLKSNRYGNWKMFRGAAAVTDGWSYNHIVELAQKELLSRGITKVTAEPQGAGVIFEVDSFAFWSHCFRLISKNIFVCIEVQEIEVSRLSPRSEGGVK